MAGIVSYGAYIPIYRLSAQVRNLTWGSGGKGERAVANWDEDSITMAVEAGRDCLKGKDAKSVDALYFASTTPPFKEKQSASMIAAALDLDENIIAADFGSSVRSATIAMRAALDAVKAGSAKNVLVVAADCRLAPPNSVHETVFGDGAAALLIGNDGVVAEVTASHQITSEFIDVWRLETDTITRTWEDRFVIDEGYVAHMKKTVPALLKANNLTAKDISKAAYYGPDVKSHGNMAKTLGLDPKTQVQNPMIDTVGNTGAALALTILAAALEEAKAGDKILLANYGDGADAHILEVNDGISKLSAKKSVSKNLESKLMLDNYGKYIKYKKLMEFEQTSDYRMRTSLPVLWRDRNWVYRFHGHKCDNCGKIQFPPQQACMYCQARKDHLHEVPLAYKTGTLFTYSLDERALVIDPPNVLAVVDLEGGGRFFSQMTDRDLSLIKVGMSMELTFRRIHDALGVHNYFWKCRPSRG